MPELPEVETVRLGLSRLIIGKVISSVRHDNPKSFPNAPQEVKEFITQAHILEIRRRAKVLLIDLSSDYTLVIHLKMTGQLVFIGNKHQGKGKSNKLLGKAPKTPVTSTLSLIPSEPSARFGAGHPSSSLTGELPDKSTRVVINFADGSKLFFNDQRKFGWVKLFPSIEVPNINFMQKFGPEPLEENLTASDFILRIRKRAGTTIKAALLDQTVIAGVGNIYADESLWGAKIHPATKVNAVSDAKLKTLLRELRLVLNLALDLGGSTDRNYVDAEGKKGSYLNFARVFRRDGKLCIRCESEIIKIRVAGRGTHLCPICQKIVEKSL